MADELIKLADELTEDWAMPFLSAAFMNAAAGYNIFLHESDGSNANHAPVSDFVL
mgnify:FL=1